MSKTLRTIALAMLAVALFAGSAFAASTAYQGDKTQAQAGTVDDFFWTGAVNDKWANAGNWRLGDGTSPAPNAPAATNSVFFDSQYFAKPGPQVVVVDAAADALDVVADWLATPNPGEISPVDVTIRIEKAGTLTIADGGGLYASPRSHLTIAGDGTLHFAAAFFLHTDVGAYRDPTMLTVDVSMTHGPAGAAGGLPTFVVGDYSELALKKPVNAANGEKAAWNHDVTPVFTGTPMTPTGPAAAAITGVPVNAVFSVSDASQLKVWDQAANASVPFTLVGADGTGHMEGTLRVTESFRIMGDRTNLFSVEFSQVKTNPGQDLIPTIEVVSGKTFTVEQDPTGTGKGQEALWHMIPGAGVRRSFAKAGTGTLVLRGIAGLDTLNHADAVLEDMMARIVVKQGTLAFEKGTGSPSSPAWQPMGMGNTAANIGHDNKEINIWAGATVDVRNTQAIRPDSTEAGNLINMVFENAGTLKVARASIANLQGVDPIGGATAQGVTRREIYPEDANVANANDQALYYMIPRAAVHMMNASTSLLQVHGDQAFTRVYGDGTIDIDAKADLITTAMPEDPKSNDSKQYRFIGTVKGAGGVGFAKLYRLIEPILAPIYQTNIPADLAYYNKEYTSQYYPYLGMKRTAEGNRYVGTKNEYEDDTLVFGLAELVVDESTLLPAPAGGEEDGSFPTVGALWLRSNVIGNVDTNFVGHLRALRSTTANVYSDTVYFAHVKIDGTRNTPRGKEESPEAMIWVNTPNAKYRPLSQIVDPLRKDYPDDRRYLVFGDVTYNVNKDLTFPGGYSQIRSFSKLGEGTLLILGKGANGQKGVSDAVFIESGRVWITHESGTGLGENDVTVTGSQKATQDWTALHVKNGLDIKNDLAFADQTALFVTEVNEKNSNYVSLEDASKQYAERSSVGITNKVEGAGSTPGIDFQGTIIQHRASSVEGYKIFKTVDEIDATVLRGYLEDAYGYNSEGYTVQTEAEAGSGQHGFVLGSSNGLFAVPYLEPKDSLLPEQTNIAFDVDVFLPEGADEADWRLDEPLAEAITGDWASLTARRIASTNADAAARIHIEGNLNVDKPNYYEDVMMTLTIVKDGNAPQYWNGHRLYTIKRQKSDPNDPNVTPTPPTPPTPVVSPDVESTSVVTVDPASEELDEGEDLVLRMAATDVEVDASGKIVKLKDADGNLVDVTDVVVMIGSTAVSNYTAELVGGAWQITVPAASVPTGTAMSVYLSGKLADGTTIKTASAGTVTKGATPGPEPTPSSSGGGGCDAGFGGLALAAAALVVLRRRG